MDYIKEMNAFYDKFVEQDFIFEDVSDYKKLLILLNHKLFWRCRLYRPQTIYYSEYCISGVMPIDRFFEIVDMATLTPVTYGIWEYNQIKKTLLSKRLNINNPTYDDLLKVWQAHCKKVYRWNSAWKRTPPVILNELIPTDRVRIPNQLRQKVIVKCDYACQYCGTVPQNSELHIDHIVPVCQGGKTVLDNLVVACQQCNLKKGGRTPEQAGMPLITSG
jgi:hypothetical protein